LIIPGLDPEEPGVIAVLCHELIMGALFYYAAWFHKTDAIGYSDCGEAVADDDGCAAPGQMLSRTVML
jgi:hypothetical protein